MATKPTENMDRVIIGVDVDGVIKDITSSDDDIKYNFRICSLVIILSSFKNVSIVVWSKRGRYWAKKVCREIGLDSCVDEFYLKGHIDVDIAIDDEHNTNLGTINLITNELGHKEKDSWFKKTN